ncbi:NAD(P)-dependent dehydrogenase (short-subunit alcohol dehydrogenase family) [Paraburkholderia sp. Clong3]
MSNATQHRFKRVWFVTGASRGLGALIAQAALANGNAVVAAGRNVRAIIERLGESSALLPVALDVTDEEQAKRAAQAALAKFGRIDVLVNNAGFGLLAAVEESADADVRRRYDTNVFGLLNVTRAVLPVMRGQPPIEDTLITWPERIARRRDSGCIARRNSPSKALRKRSTRS